MKITCKQSAVRSSELRDREITWKRKLELWFHVTICRFCRIYNRQIEKLGRFSRLIGENSCGSDDSLDDKTVVKLSDEAKSRMKQNLKT
jgi:hypothetical protein